MKGKGHGRGKGARKGGRGYVREFSAEEFDPAWEEEYSYEEDDYLEEVEDFELEGDEISHQPIGQKEG